MEYLYRNILRVKYGRHTYLCNICELEKIVAWHLKLGTYIVVWTTVDVILDAVNDLIKRIRMHFVPLADSNRKTLIYTPNSINCKSFHLEHNSGYYIGAIKLKDEQISLRAQGHPKT